MTLSEHVERLLAFLDQFGVPPHTGIRVVELARSEIAAPRLALAAERLATIESYADRFASLLQFIYNPQSR